MRRSRLLGWIIPAVMTTAIAVYAVGLVSGRWRGPAHGQGITASVHPDSTDPEQRRAQAELCPLINRPDVLELVERPATVTSIGTSYDPKSDWHQCAVSLPNSALRLNVTHDRTRVADYRKLFPEAQPRTVLGRPAVWTTGPALLTNSGWKTATLLVAWDRADSGGMVEITILRVAVRPGDEAALTTIAERQLPNLPGWPA